MTKSNAYLKMSLDNFVFMYEMEYINKEAINIEDNTQKGVLIVTSPINKTLMGDNIASVNVRS